MCADARPLVYHARRCSRQAPVSTHADKRFEKRREGHANRRDIYTLLRLRGVVIERQILARYKLCRRRPESKADRHRVYVLAEGGLFVVSRSGVVITTLPQLRRPVAEDLIASALLRAMGWPRVWVQR